MPLNKETKPNHKILVFLNLKKTDLKKKIVIGVLIQERQIIENKVVTLKVDANCELITECACGLNAADALFILKPVPIFIRICDHLLYSYISYTPIRPILLILCN